MLLVFDFDGTICDTLPAVLTIAKKYLLENNLPEMAIAEARSLGIRAIIRRYHLSPLKMAAIAHWSRPLMIAAYPTLSPFPDIPSVIKQLAKTHTLGIITSTDAALVEGFLARHGLNSYFSFIDGGVDLFGKQHKIKKHPVDYYIGDESRDIIASQKAGCKSVAVTWGYEDETLLASAFPDYLVRLPSELLTIFQ